MGTNPHFLVVVVVFVVVVVVVVVVQGVVGRPVNRLMFDEWVSALTTAVEVLAVVVEMVGSW